MITMVIEEDNRQKIKYLDSQGYKWDTGQLGFGITSNTGQLGMGGSSNTGQLGMGITFNTD